MPLNQPHHFLKWSVLTLCLFCGVCTHHIQAQDPVYWQITDEEGLPSMTVYEMVQDTFGYIWLGTANGLVRYDGLIFKPYNHPTQKDNEIVTVRKDDFGRIWFSDLANQLYYVENDSIYYFWGKEFRANNELESYFISKNKLILNLKNKKKPGTTTLGLISLNSNLSKNDTNAIVLLPENPGERFTYFKENGITYACIYDAAFENYKNFRIDENGVIEVNFSDFIRTQNISLAITSNCSFYEFKGTLFVHLANKVHYKKQNSDKISSLIFSQMINQVHFFGQEIWYLTKGGLVVAQFGEKIQLKKHLFQNICFNNFFKDKEGNFWFATDNQGVIIVPSMDIIKINLQDDNASVYSITPDLNQKYLFIGQSEGLINIVDNKEGKVIQKLSFSPTSGRVIKILQQDKVFFGTDNGLLFKEEFLAKEYHMVVKSIAIKDLLIDRNNYLWVATSLYSTRIPLETHPYNDYPHEKLLNIRSYAVFEAINGDIWIGSTQGIFIFRQGVMVPFLEEEKQIPYNVKSIIQTKDSSIWIATNTDGLIRIKNDFIITRYNTSNFLKYKNCNTLLEDGEYLWVGTTSGLLRLNIKDNQLDCIDKFDGLPSQDILSVAVLESMVWVGTPKGLFSFPKNSIVKNTIAPPIYITNVSIHDKDTTMYEQYQLKYHQNNLQFDFLGLGFRARGNIKYQYQMLGIDTLWTETEARFARFPALNPGTYTFNVMAINEDGTKSASPASIKIFIAPPWWATWWFRISAITGLVGLVWLLLHLRYKNIRKREIMQQQFDKKVNELSMLALQTQMNPHFIFNSLNAIQQFLTTNDRESAMNYLSKFARLIRMVFEQSGKKKISLEEELEFLKIYLALESLRFNNEVEIELKISDEIEQRMDDYFVLPLLIQPVIENAFKHGLFHKKDEKKLSILFKKAGNYLKCTIIDNGVGRAKTEEINQWKSGNHKSSGLKTTKERLDIFHQNHPEFKHEPYFKITDLHHQGQPCGTKVEVVI